MSNKVLYLLTAITGAAIGSAVTWQYAKKKYEQIAQEEIDSVKAMFAKCSKREDSKTEYSSENVLTASENKKVDNRVNYSRALKEAGYTSEETPEKTKLPKMINHTEPYVITPEEFGEIYEYGQISLTYYEDGVLADENDEPVEDVDECVGFDSLTHFGEYEDDSVFVRNDEKKCDYEILKNYSKYADVVKKRPHFRMEV